MNHVNHLHDDKHWIIYHFRHRITFHSNIDKVIKNNNI